MKVEINRRVLKSGTPKVIIIFLHNNKCCCIQHAPLNTGANVVGI